MQVGPQYAVVTAKQRHLPAREHFLCARQAQNLTRNWHLTLQGINTGSPMQDSLDSSFFGSSAARQMLRPGSAAPPSALAASKAIILHNAGAGCFGSCPSWSSACKQLAACIDCMMLVLNTVCTSSGPSQHAIDSSMVALMVCLLRPQLFGCQQDAYCIVFEMVSLLPGYVASLLTA